MKPTFKNHEKPLFTVMIQKRTPGEILDTMKAAIPCGADAFGIQFEQMRPEYRNESVYKEIFSNTGGLPTYITNYRSDRFDNANKGKSDEQLAKELVEIARCGGTLMDVMGDMFCKHPEELTDNAEAVKKQMALIDEIHSVGGEVLMSSHVLKYTSAERVLEIALAQQERGADVVKIVTHANDDIEQGENLKIVGMLKKELKVPFLYLCGGNCQVLRRIGPMLGCGMWLCVYERDELCTRSQPLLHQVKAIWDNFFEN